MNFFIRSEDKGIKAAPLLYGNIAEESRVHSHPNLKYLLLHRNPYYTAFPYPLQEWCMKYFGSFEVFRSVSV